MMQERLGALLLQTQKHSQQDLNMGLALQRASQYHRRLGEVLIEYKLAQQEEILESISKQTGWPLFDGAWDISLKLLEDLGEAFFKDNIVFPLDIRGQKGAVFYDGERMDVVDLLRSRYMKGISFFIADKKKIEESLSKVLINKQENRIKAETISEEAQHLLQDAIVLQASDIHIEPSLMGVEVRLRIDGVLHFWKAFPMADLGRIVNVFFHRAEINAGDFLKFHDASFSYLYQQRRIDIRLSHIPTVYGSALVLRLLNIDKDVVHLKTLGYEQQQHDVLQQLLNIPQGLLLVTGPTGCGKTTTLYAMLDFLRDVKTKVVTIEDPVEMRLPLVTQIEVNLKKGYDFSNIMRAVLRHDPDVVFIGEIRDEKTSKEALRAAMTGHRVLSTLHTNDALSAILRLKDLGVDQIQMANVLIGVIAQRLVRKLCPYCKVEKSRQQLKIKEEECKYLDEKLNRVYQPVGCEKCFGGFKGRMVISEVLKIDNGMRFLIEQGLFQELFVQLRNNREKTSLYKDVKRVIALGETSLDEAVRVLG